MKRFLVALGLVFGTASVQAEGFRQETIPLLIDFDVDSPVYYPHSQGVPIATFGATSRAEGTRTSIKSSIRISTTAASATITATVASSAPFSAIQVGDFIRFTTPGNTAPDVMDALEGQQTPWLVVVTRTNANQISVNQLMTSATPADGVSFEWRRGLSAATEGAGWIDVSGFDKALFVVNTRALVSAMTGLGISVQCRVDMPGIDTFSATTVAPRYGTDGTATYPSSDCGGFTLTGAGAGSQCIIPSGIGAVALPVDTSLWDECRLRLTFDDDVEGGTVDRVYANFVGYSAK